LPYRRHLQKNGFNLIKFRAEWAQKIYRGGIDRCSIGGKTIGFRRYD